MDQPWTNQQTDKPSYRGVMAAATKTVEEVPQCQKSTLCERKYCTRENKIVWTGAKIKICGQVGGKMDNNYWFHIFLKVAMKNKEVLYKEYMQTGNITESNVIKVWYIFIHGKIKKNRQNEDH